VKYLIVEFDSEQGILRLVLRGELRDNICLSVRTRSNYRSLLITQRSIVIIKPLAAEYFLVLRK